MKPPTMSTSAKAQIIRDAHRAGLLEDYAGSISIRRDGVSPEVWEIIEGDALIELVIEFAQRIEQLEDDREAYHAIERMRMENESDDPRER